MSSRVLEKREWPLLELPAHIDGPVWDIGANVGYLALTAAGLGRSVVAFEMSTRAVELMEKSRAANQLDFNVVPRAFSVQEKTYIPPSTSHPGNQLSASSKGDSHTITYTEAEKLFGVPALIKMDIEGMEKDFFTCDDFKQWIISQEIFFVVEVHSSLIGFTPTWGDVPHVQLPSTHYLYCGDALRLNRLMEDLGLALRA